MSDLLTRGSRRHPGPMTQSASALGHLRLGPTCHPARNHNKQSAMARAIGARSRFLLPPSSPYISVSCCILSSSSMVRKKVGEGVNCAAVGDLHRCEISVLDVWSRGVAIVRGSCPWPRLELSAYVAG
jgi:hypothetical protein